MKPEREPTPQECESNAKIGDGFAIWYPQMGGYVGRAIIVPEHECFTAYVWHDGEFPFSDADGPGVMRLHHCDPAQFVAFGNTVARLISKPPP